MSALNLFLLGSPRVELDGRSLEITSRKGLALLIYLAVTGQPHTRDALATLLWPDYDSSRGRTRLRRALWELKEAVGEDWVVATQETIELNPQAEIRVDVDEFRRMAKAPQQHGHPPGESCPACLEHLAQAAALYQGDFLAGYGLPDSAQFDEWQFFQAEELRRLLAGSLERLAFGLAAEGELEPALAYARRWVALDPLHEPAQRALIQLYGASGQQAAAKRQYEQVVELLEEELGLEPQPETDEVYEAALRRRAEAAQGAPELVVGPAGVEPGAMPMHHNLRPQSTPFVGREKELGEAVRLLVEEPACRLLTLMGPGGFGKTRLAQQTLRRLAEMPAGESGFREALFVPLAAEDSASGMISAVARAAGLEFYESAAPEAQLMDYLRGRQILLALDNFEQLLVPDARSASLALVAGILEACTEIKLLVTSREALPLKEAWVLPLSGLSFPRELEDPLEPGRYEAVRLFEQSARRVRGDLDFAGERQQIARVCRLVEGSPLAIELAAAWLPALTVRDVADEIERSLDFLAARDYDRDPRHRSMRAVLEHSWALLDAPERDALARLSVFRGGFLREAARDAAEAQYPTLAGLADKSLVRLEEGGRYNLHELLRQFAAEKLSSVPADEREARQAHSRYYLDFLTDRAQAMHGPQQKTALRELRHEVENLLAAWEWAVSLRDVEQVETALAPLFDFFWLRSDYSAGEAAFERVAERLSGPIAPEGSSLPALQARSRLGAFSVGLGKFKQAQGLLETGLEEARLLNVAEERAFALIFLGEIARVQGDIDRALDHFQEALAVSRTAMDRPGMARALQRLGWVLEEDRGDFEQGRRYYSESLELFQELGRRADVAFLLDKLGLNAWKRGAYNESEAYYRESLGLFQEIGDRLGEAKCLGGLAIVEMARGGDRLVEAQRLAEESLAISMETGNRYEQANRLRIAALVALAQDKPDEAERYASRGLSLSDELGYDSGVIIALLDLGKAAVRRVEFTTAREHLCRALRRAVDHRKRAQVMEGLAVWADLLMREGRPELQPLAHEIQARVAAQPETWHVFFKDQAAESGQNAPPLDGPVRSAGELAEEVLEGC